MCLAVQSLQPPAMALDLYAKVKEPFHGMNGKGGPARTHQVISDIWLFFLRFVVLETRREHGFGSVIPRLFGKKQKLRREVMADWSFNPWKRERWEKLVVQLAIFFWCRIVLHLSRTLCRVCPVASSHSNNYIMRENFSRPFCRLLFVCFACVICSLH